MITRSVTSLVLVGACLALSTGYTAAFAEKIYKHTQTESNLGLKGMGPRIGFVDPEGVLDGTVEIGMVFDFGEFTPQLKWDGSVSFWSSDRTYRYYDTPHNDWRYYDWKLRDLILRSGVNYYFMADEWVPFVGGGIGMHFYSWDYNDYPNHPSPSETRIGIYIDGGIEHDFGESWTSQVQLQFDSADIDQTALMFNFIHRFE